LLTGDFGRLDEEGFLTLLGRKDDMINCGGHSFFPAEVEVDLGRIPGVSSYLVAGVPDPAGLMTDVPWLFAVADPDSECSSAIVIRIARERLSSQMIPRQVVWIDQIPLTASGKPNRRQTVELYGPQPESVTN